MRPRWHKAQLLRPGRWGIMQRLVALVLVPTLGTIVFVVISTQNRQRTLEDKVEVRHAVDRATDLVAARTALLAERVPTQAVVATRLVAIDADASAGLVVQGAAAELSRRQAGSDAALAALGPHSPVTASDLASARRLVDVAAPDLTLAAFRPLEDRLDTAIGATLAADRLRSHLDGSSPAIDVLVAARRAIAAADATHQQLSALGLLTTGLGDRAALTDALSTANIRESIEVGQLDDAFLPAVADAWRPIRQDPATNRYHEAIDRAATGDQTALPALGIDGPVHEQRMIALVPELTGIAGGLAAAEHDQAGRDLYLGMALPAAVAVSGMGLCLYFARSITRPFRKLVDHAAAIGAGDLAVAPLRESGPREIAVAFGAFNDLVANLRLIDAKSQALADLDLDAPVLAEPLPGRLGATLQQSARALSGSIGERDDLRQRLMMQATHDALTGLHNRAAAADHLEQALGRARRAEEGVAVLHIDLNDFKRVNETHGNAVGDIVLCEIASRLCAIAGDGAFVGRLGGDEFVVVAEDVRDAGAVNELARHLRAAASQPIVHNGTRITLGASVGIAFTWDGADAAHDVLTWAELAVHRAKQRAAGGVEIYDQGIQEQLREVAEVEDALSAALPRDELFLQYQPVIDMATGRMSSVEALVRWARPGMGVRPPDSFIPIAERSDLIISLDTWVMASAARQLQEWEGHEDLTDIGVAINVSGRHLLSQSLYDHVVELLDATGIAAGRLIIEITETVLVNDLVAAAAQLEAVRGLGVRIALDDFGTGYTSITHLRQLPIDIIKIDRSFVQRLASEKDRTLLAMITDLGHHLGLTITAEGVETPEQYDLLRELGCDRAQGFLMSHPIPADALETWAHEQDAALT